MLRGYDKEKNLYTFSRDTAIHFFPNIFDLQWVESMNTEPTYMEGWLYKSSYKCCRLLDQYSLFWKEIMKFWPHNYEKDHFYVYVDCVFCIVCCSLLTLAMPWERNIIPNSTALSLALWFALTSEMTSCWLQAQAIRGIAKFYFPLSICPPAWKHVLCSLRPVPRMRTDWNLEQTGTSPESWN